MYPTLYEQIDNVGTVPVDNGLGILTDCLECMVTEERNGIYELTLKYPTSGIHAKELKERRILKAKPNYTDDPQLFRIYNIGKELNGSFTVNARHITYDLSGYVITTGTAANAVLACDLLQNNAPNWTINTDKDVTANFKIYEPSSVRSWFGGKEGSLLDVYGTAEWKYDNFECSLLSHRGTDRGVKVKYAKNLLTLTQDLDSDNIITGVLPYWKDSQTNEVVIGQTQSTSVSLDVPNIYTLDCSSTFQEKPTVAQLNTEAIRYIGNHNTQFVKQNIKLDFLQIGQLKDRVDLCDTVEIEYPDFGISGTAKCITTKWDVIKERYDSIEIGEPKTNIADTIVSVEKTSNNAMTRTEMSGAIDRATSLITGNSGGYIVLHDSNNDGQPDELLIMNTPDISTATKVWRWNLSGLGYSDTGYDGTYGLAMTMDGAINCAFLKTGNLVFGGTDGNEDGSLTIHDANNNVIANFNKAGCIVKGQIVATSFTADATSGIDVQIGSNGGTGVNNWCGINIYDDSLTDPTIPVITLGRAGNSDQYIMHMKDNDQAFAFEVRTGGGLTTNSNAELMLEAHGSNPRSTFGVVRIVAVGDPTDTSQYNNNSYGFLRVEGKAHSDNSRRALQFDGNNPGNIFLGPITIYNGVMYGSVTGDLRGISLRGANSDASYIYLIDNSGVAKIIENGNSGNIQCVSLTQTSTRKVKENIEELSEDEASKILLLVPVTYDFKDKECGTDKRGFIAEDVEEVIPQVVTKDEDNNPQGINYTELIPYLTKMIQMQQKQIEDLENRVKELERSK